MLILKGKSGKSRIVDYLLRCPKNLCFVYNEYCPPSFEGAVWVDQLNYTFEEFKKCVDILLKERIDSVLDIVIYTNLSEAFIKADPWFDQFKDKSNVIVTCI